MDDERLKVADRSLYYDELLERIRDIRSSEKVFWKKIFDNQDELDTLKRIMMHYLEYPELQAKQKRFMAMKDWIAKSLEEIKVIDSEIPKTLGISPPNFTPKVLYKNFYLAFFRP